MSEIDVNSTHEILKELRTFRKEIRDLLLQKTVQENGTTQQINGAWHQREGSPEVPDATLDTEMANVETDNSDNWPDDETIEKYRNRCANHKSECDKMQLELGCFIAHLGIIEGNNDVIEKAESLRKGLLHPVQCLEKAFNATPDGRPNVMSELQTAFNTLDVFIHDFVQSPHQKDAVYPDKINPWSSFTCNGRSKIYYLVCAGKFVECLEFIHDIFFSELETAMGGVIEALMIFEEKSASEWLAKQNMWDFDKHMKSIFPPTGADDSTSAWADPVEIVQFKERSISHKLSCNEMREELGHLIAHYGVVGGDKEVVKEAKVLQSSILAPLDCLERTLTLSPNVRRNAMIDAVVSYKAVYIYVSNFQKSLYHQKHAFYFRKVKKWVNCLWNGMLKIISLLRERKVVECQRFIYNNLLFDLEEAMIGVCKAPENVSLPGQKADTGSVVGELKTFGKESLPKFLVDQMERDTTRYVNLTTIATFFSSVTATTLQFTYAATDTVPSNSLRGVVNLFWFLSLVFSVSSGVNSLLGLTWRKSSIYDSRVPPKVIRMWFDKAPMLFLIIAAVAFVIGLNLFAYLSLQPRYVSFATTILTGVHGVCLLAVTAWFIYQLKHDSIWAGWVRTAMKPFTTIAQWIRSGVKWIWKSMKWIWKLIKRPYEKYKQNLHLQRNIYWAFGIDNCVARLNYNIYWGRDLPGPYLLSKLIRGISYPIKRCWLMTKKAISDLSHTVRAHICVLSRTGRTGDVEMGEILGREDVEVPVETFSPDKKAKDEFRKSLRKVFSNAEWVMSYIEDQEYEIMEIKEINYLEWILWGYPSLVEKFDAVVRPALAEAREKTRREREEADQQDTATENDAIGSLVPDVAGQDTDDTTPVPPQSSQTAPLDDKPGRSDITQTDVRPDSQGQPANNLPPTPDERALLTASGNSEALEPTSGDPIPVPDIEGGTTSQVLFTSEGLHIAQSKEELGE